MHAFCFRLPELCLDRDLGPRLGLDGACSRPVLPPPSWQLAQKVPCAMSPNAKRPTGRFIWFQSAVERSVSACLVTTGQVQMQPPMENLQLW